MMKYLAVAYQYTIGDQVYQVGEFGTDGVDAVITSRSKRQIPSSQALILKMLKSSLTNVQKPMLEFDDEEHLSNSRRLSIATGRF